LSGTSGYPTGAGFPRRAAARFPGRARRRTRPRLPGRAALRRRPARRVRAASAGAVRRRIGRRAARRGDEGEGDRDGADKERMRRIPREYRSSGPPTGNAKRNRQDARVASGGFSWARLENSRDSGKAGSEWRSRYVGPLALETAAEIRIGNSDQRLKSRASEKNQNQPPSRQGRQQRAPLLGVRWRLGGSNSPRAHRPCDGNARIRNSDRRFRSEIQIGDSDRRFES
jgi:hypothetical protein